jgi:hypothetical protein
LFASNHPPTALLVAKPRHVFFVVGYLLRHGIKSPGASHSSPAITTRISNRSFRITASRASPSLTACRG